MSKRIYTLTVCDLPHDDDEHSPADAEATTVRIDDGDGTYAVDMCDRHLTEHLRPLTSAGRRVSRVRRTRTSTRT